jgi:hypothetical protein
MVQGFAVTDRVLHLDGVGPIPSTALDESFWSAPDRPELLSGHLLSAFSYEGTWDYQERHPDGDEVAIVLDGVIDLLLEDDAGPRGAERAARIRRGEAGIVPAGAWHRLAVHEPATIVFLTPVPARTQHRPVAVPT